MVTEMAKRSIDRRVARTRAMLQQAHISLILEKGYEAITIEDICDKANVGRSTFYAHYTSKDDAASSTCACNSPIGRRRPWRRREISGTEAWASA